MIKRLILLQFSLLSLLLVNAQQDVGFVHWHMNKVFENPAFAGLQGEICANVINRQQWVGLEGAPQTTLFTINSPIKVFGINSGVGISLLDDRLGFEKNFAGALTYSYIHELSTGTLSFGTNLGIFNKTFEGDYKFPDGTTTIDPVVPQSKDQSLVFDMSFGAVYTIDNLYVGLSVNHLVPSKFKITTENGGEIKYLKRHYYLMSGYKYSLPNSSLEFMPNLLVKYDGASPQITINLNTLYNKKLWGGVSYSTTEVVDINIGIELFNGIKIGYAYGLNLSKFINTNTGSHEVMLGYCFNFEFSKAPQKYRSVRFL